MQRLLILIIALAVSLPIFACAGERAVYAKTPDYPADARDRHLTGSGAFALHVRPDGSVERVETLQSIGHSSLDRAAIAAFRVWRFHPDRGQFILRVPIRYVDGPPRTDALMSQPPRPGYGALITVFSRAK
jgi:TonB family protein